MKVYIVLVDTPEDGYKVLGAYTNKAYAEAKMLDWLNRKADIPYSSVNDYHAELQAETEFNIGIGVFAEIVEQELVDSADDTLSYVSFRDKTK